MHSMTAAAASQRSAWPNPMNVVPARRATKVIASRIERSNLSMPGGHRHTTIVPDGIDTRPTTARIPMLTAADTRSCEVPVQARERRNTRLRRSNRDPLGPGGATSVRIASGLRPRHWGNSTTGAWVGAGSDS
jgi:hypothetical protein